MARTIEDDLAMLSPAHREQALLQINPQHKVVCQKQPIVAKETVAKSKPTPRGMNPTEAKYADHLEILRHARVIVSWKFEAIRLRLANRAWFKPDFLVVARNEDKDCDVFQFHEVKGFWREAARVRIKVAADLFPEFNFVAIQRKGGVWVEERF
jgi:hypothetical protein